MGRSGGGGVPVILAELRRFRAPVLLLLWAFVTLGAAAGSPKRVLILNPFGRDVEPFSAAVSSFRSTLARDLGEPVDFHEIPLDLARFTGPEGEAPLIDFLDERIKSQAVDLVVPIGGAGVQFAARHRERLFPRTPMLVIAAEPRMIPAGFLGPDTTLVTQRIVLSGMVEDILRMQPDTARIAVVMGSSPLEKFWVEEFRREFEPFRGRVEFIWLTDLTLEQTIGRCSTLPPRSFILHGLFLVDAAGVPCEKGEALQRLHKAANAPVFAYFASEFGQGGAGGRLFQNSEIGRLGAGAALRILRGEQAGAIPPLILEAADPVYDWRELRRWKIDESKLPAGSLVMFREPGFWERYHWVVTGVLLFGILQGVLIVGLIANRKKIRRAEKEANLLAGISSKFVNLPAAEVDREIMDAQRRICELLDLDLSALWQWSDVGPGTFTATHVYSLQHGPQPPVPLSDDDYPWVRQEILAGRLVAARSLDEMPPEAAKDCESARRVGIRSHLTLPLAVGGESPVGVLGFNTIREERSWPEPLVKRLQLVAQIFANALARKRADHDLRESASKIRQLSHAVEQSPVLVVMTDLQGRITYVNRKFTEVTGYTPEESIGRKPSILKSGEASPSAYKELWSCISKGRTWRGEFHNRKKNGELYWEWAVISPVFDASGKVSHYVGVKEDITDQRESETEVLELRETLAHAGRVTLLGNLASALAHELSQPLGAILRNAEAAEMMLGEATPDLDELRAIVTDILRDDQRAGQVIDRLRSLLKRGNLDLQPVDLPEVITGVLSLLQADAASRQVKIIPHLAPGLPVVRGDRIHLQQVVLNLLVNAMDATAAAAPGDRVVQIHARLADPATVEVCVSDTGPGIPPAAMGRLFEPFFTTKATGMGMGLPVSKTIIDAHKGKLWAENGLERGACFRFTLQVVRNEPGGPHAP